MRENATQAVETITDTVLANPALRTIAENARTLDDLKALWKHDAFRKSHDVAIADVSQADIKAYVDELSDDDLQGVTGGTGFSVPSLQQTSPQDAYITALALNIKRQLGG
jgi:hypothetical protein